MTGHAGYSVLPMIGLSFPDRRCGDEGGQVLRFTLRQLEYLVAVGDCGSVTIAAERQRVSAPSISVAISQIEAEMGVPLFIRRHAQGMTATAQGKTLIAHARQVLDQARLMVEAANAMSGTVRGSLTIGCLSTFAQIVMARLRRTFHEACPDVDFHQIEAHQMALIDGLREARIDMALTYDLAIPTDLAFEGLVELPPFALFAEDHPLAGQDSVTPAELAGFPLVLIDLPHSADYFLSLFDGSGHKPVIFERSADIAVVQSMVGNGFGYSIANMRPRSAEAPDGRKLRFVPLAGRVKPIRVGLLSAPGIRELPTVGAFAGLARSTIPTLVQGFASPRAHVG
jgi:DNA-binding transcriptional LysR family regulator